MSWAVMPSVLAGLSVAREHAPGTAANSRPALIFFEQLDQPVELVVARERDVHVALALAVGEGDAGAEPAREALLDVAGVGVLLGDGGLLLGRSGHASAAL